MVVEVQHLDGPWSAVHLTWYNKNAKATPNDEGWKLQAILLDRGDGTDLRIDLTK